ncbi:isochorismatase family protein [Microbacteriaceae bacterium]|nr:isochorismatase family protein [Candidatus Saccharibacteria bacterium]
MTERTKLPITIDRLVAVGVDIQHDFIDGSLAVTSGEKVVEPMNTLTSYVRRLGGVAVFTRDWHPEHTDHFKKWPVHCVAHTHGAEFHPLLHIAPNDIIISKGMSTKDDGYSGFEGISDDGRTLESLIQPRNRYERVGLIIGGLATDYCDLATVIDALDTFRNQPNVYTVAAVDAMRAVNLQDEDGLNALRKMEHNGAYLVNSDDVLDGNVFHVRSGA